MPESALKSRKNSDEGKRHNVFIRRVGYASQGSSFSKKMMDVQQS